MDGITDEELTNEEFEKPLTETKDENEFTLEHLKWLSENSYTNQLKYKKNEVNKIIYTKEEVDKIIENFEKNKPLFDEKSEYTIIRQISDFLYDNVQYKVPDPAGTEYN